MPALRLTRGATATPARTAPKRASKPAAKATPKRKPAAVAKAPARKAAAKPKPAAASTNGSVKLPEGWTQADWNQMIKDMQRAVADKSDAEKALKESARLVNELALESIEYGVSMATVVDNLNLSRQWLYTIMAKPWTVNKDRWKEPKKDRDGNYIDAENPKYQVLTQRQANAPHPNKGLTQEEIDAKAAKPKPAAKRTAKKPPARVASKPAAKRSPARKAPAAKRTPARKPAAGRGRVLLSR